MNSSGDSADLTTGSVTSVATVIGSNYVSCIKVNGKPILPPVMTESLRAEMRRYRELAIRVETTLDFKKRQKPPSKVSQVPMNTTVTLSPSLKQRFLPTPPSSSEPKEASPSFTEHEYDEEEDETSMLLPQHFSISSLPLPESSLPQTAFDMLYQDHFVIKKPQHVPAFPSSDEGEGGEDGDESASSDSFKSAEPSAGVTYIKLAEEEELINPIAPPPFFQDEPPPENQPHAVEDDENYQSEAMSLISLDEQERHERKSMEDDEDDEIDCITEKEVPASGRSSTETYTIDKHYVSSDSENNNESAGSNGVHKYFYSPCHNRYGGEADETSEDASNIFNSETAPDTVKSHRTGRYFDSPPDSPTEHLTDISSVASVTSSTSSAVPDHSDTVRSFLSPNSTSSSKSGVRKRFYFSSPEETPNKSDTVNFESNNTAAETNRNNNKTLPTRIPSPRKVLQLSPTKTNPQQQPPPTTPTKVISNNPYSRPPSTPTKSQMMSSSCHPEKENQQIKPQQLQQPCSPKKVQPEITTTRLRTPTKIKHQGKAANSAASGNIQVTKTDVSTTNKQSSANLTSTNIDNKDNNSIPEGESSTMESMDSLTVADNTVNTGRQRQTSSPVIHSLTRVNLSTLQTTLQNMSPSIFKAPPDARSPLLKGIIFMDPLFRPKRELRIPPQALDPAMQPKFAKVTALAKGFLVRRLLRTEKLQMIIQTIRDTVDLVLKLYEEVPQLKIRGWKGVNPEDSDLCRRLFQQLTGTCSSFHDVFFKLTTTQRMAIIASDREKRKAKEMKSYLSRSRSVRASTTRGPKGTGANSNNKNVSKRKISTATAKCLERRMSSALHS